MAAGDEAHAAPLAPEDPDTEPEDAVPPAPACSGAVLGLLQASKVWISSKTEVWQQATVQRAAGDTLHVLTVESGEECTVAAHEAHAFDSSHEADLDDLATMNMLHEAPLLTSLGRRYKGDKIYTYTGDVLISVNPYKQIPRLYDMDLAGFDSSKPHLYSVGYRAHAALAVEGKNQSVIISGESGAGKTEASKEVMRFLLALSATGGGSAVDVEAVLLRSNVVLEAFGNAKTIRNDNSSRFGKYIRLVYDADWRIAGAATDHFLLEKSRLVQVARGERNYHVFYQLLAPPGLHGAAADYGKLTMGGVVTASDDVSDDVEFRKTMGGLEACGVSSEERDAVCRALAALLRLGALEFGEEVGQGSSGCVVVGDYAQVARLLGVEAFLLKTKLVSFTKSSPRGSFFTISFSPATADDNAAALVKFLYASLFDWLLRKLNCEHSRGLEDASVLPFVGILDIFGFEIVERNSLEQLCINFTNEVLQRQFNARVFAAEAARYEAEGLDAAFVHYRENQDLLDVVAGRPRGLFFILEEHGIMSRAPDNGAMLAAFNSQHGSAGRYAKPRFDAASKFVLRHYAGDIHYDVTHWIEKNNDALAHDMKALLDSTEDALLRHVLKLPRAQPGVGAISSEAPVQAGFAETAARRTWTSPETRRLPRGKKMASAASVSKKFRTQLASLLSLLESTSPHYIKTIKPNAVKAPGGYSNQLVVRQLRCSGVLEVVRIRREGFPTRAPFIELYAAYEALLRNGVGAGGSDSFMGFLEARFVDEAEARRGCKKLLETHLSPETAQLGKSTVFLSIAGQAALDAAVAALYAKRATAIATLARGRRARDALFAARRGATTLSAMARGAAGRTESGKRRKRLGVEAAFKRDIFALRLRRLNAAKIRVPGVGKGVLEAQVAEVAALAALEEAKRVRQRVENAFRKDESAIGASYAAVRSAIDAVAAALARLDDTVVEELRRIKADRAARCAALDAAADARTGALLKLKAESVEHSDDGTFDLGAAAASARRCVAEALQRRADAERASNCAADALSLVDGADVDQGAKVLVDAECASKEADALLAAALEAEAAALEGQEALREARAAAVEAELELLKRADADYARALEALRAKLALIKKDACSTDFAAAAAAIGRFEAAARRLRAASEGDGARSTLWQNVREAKSLADEALAAAEAAARAAFEKAARRGFFEKERIAQEVTLKRAAMDAAIEGALKSKLCRDGVFLNGAVSEGLETAFNECVSLEGELARNGALYDAAALAALDDDGAIQAKRLRDAHLAALRDALRRLNDAAQKALDDAAAAAERLNKSADDARRAYKVLESYEQRLAHVSHKVEALRFESSGDAADAAICNAEAALSCVGDRVAEAKKRLMSSFERFAAERLLGSEAHAYDVEACISAAFEVVWDLNRIESGLAEAQDVSARARFRAGLDRMVHDAVGHFSIAQCEDHPAAHLTDEAPAAEAAATGMVGGILARVRRASRRASTAIFGGAALDDAAVEALAAPARATVRWAQAASNKLDAAIRNLSTVAAAGDAAKIAEARAQADAAGAALDAAAHEAARAAMKLRLAAAEARCARHTVLEDYPTAAAAYDALAAKCRVALQEGSTLGELGFDESGDEATPRREKRSREKRSQRSAAALLRSVEALEKACYSAAVSRRQLDDDVVHKAARFNEGTRRVLDGVAQRALRFGVAADAAALRELEAVEAVVVSLLESGDVLTGKDRTLKSFAALDSALAAAAAANKADQDSQFRARGKAEAERMVASKGRSELLQLTSRHTRAAYALEDRLGIVLSARAEKEARPAAFDLARLSSEAMAAFDVCNSASDAAAAGAGTNDGEAAAQHALEALRSAEKCVEDFEASVQKCIDGHVAAATTIQAAARTAAARRALRRAQRSATVIATLARMVLQRAAYRRAAASAKALQALCRERVAQRRFAAAKAAALTLAQAVRMRMAARELERRFKRRQSAVSLHLRTVGLVVAMQAGVRRRQGTAFAAKRKRAAKCVGRTARLLLSILRRLKQRKAASLLAATMRRSKARRDYAAAKSAVLAVQCCVRRVSALRRAEHRAWCALRIGRTLRATKRSRVLRRLLDALHDVALEASAPFDSSALDGAWDLAHVRHRGRGLRTLAHSAAFGGNVAVLEALVKRESADHFLFARDNEGDTVLHCACAAARLDAVKVVLQCLDRVTPSARFRVTAFEANGAAYAKLPSIREAKNGACFNAGPAPSSTLRGIRAARAAEGAQQKSALKFFAATWPRSSPSQKSIFGGGGATKAAAAATEADAFAPVVFKGVLKKRKEGDAWKARFCVLTAHSLAYFQRERDKRPIKTLTLRNAVVRRSQAAPYAFEVHSSEMLQSGNNSKGRMHFAAETQDALFAWLKALREGTVATSHTYVIADGESTAHVSLRARRDAVNALNNRGRSPLHAVARAARDKSGAPSARAVQAACYLVEFGAQLDARDSHKATPLHDAVKLHRDVAAAFVRLGADAGVKDASGKTPLDYASADLAQSFFVSDVVDREPHLGAPGSRALSCTYLSTFIGKVAIDEADRIPDPYLRITVLDRMGRHIERAQQIWAPVLKRKTYLLFGKTWHLQSAIEDLDFGVCVLFELRTRRARVEGAKEAGAKEDKTDDMLLGWARLALNQKSVSTAQDSLEFFKPPLPARARAAPASPTSPTHALNDDAEPLGAFLACETYLTKDSLERPMPTATPEGQRHNRTDLI
ncbi:hypothetical protein M885DRAFT_584614 [Pelagophyceae sp. CCMP2097]|nr:hypothetical protein M885DRAFT_584614 [Pelagophyceae sp. CCMP2097]